MRSKLQQRGMGLHIDRIAAPFECILPLGCALSIRNKLIVSVKEATWLRGH